MNTTDIERSLEAASRAIAELRDLRAEEPGPYREAGRRFRAAIDQATARGEAAVEPLARYAGAGQPPAAALGAAAVHALAAIGSPAASGVLVEAALDPNPVVSQRALKALLHLPPSDAHRERLRAAFERARGGGAAQAILAALLKQGGADVLRLAADILAGERDAELRRTVAKRLGGLPDPRAEELLRRAMEDRDAGVRVEAAFQLVLDGDADALAAILEAAADRRTSAREDALLALAGLPRPEGAEVVQRALADPSPAVREAALLAAAMLGEPALVEPAVALLRDPKPGVRHQAEAVFWPLTGSWLPQDPEAAVELALDAAAGATAERSYRGAPLALDTLATLLYDGSWNRFADSNLVAMSGRRSGVEPDAELPWNLEAILGWEAWVAEHRDGFEPGGWYYHGRRLPAPRSAKGRRG